MSQGKMYAGATFSIVIPIDNCETGFSGVIKFISFS